MKKALLLLVLMSSLTGCESVSVELTPSLYPQRDLTIRWPERQYWQAPAGFTGVQTPPAADGAPRTTATDVTPRSAPVAPAAAPVKATGRPRPGRRLRTACAKGSC